MMFFTPMSVVCARAVMCKSWVGNSYVSSPEWKIPYVSAEKPKKSEEIKKEEKTLGGDKDEDKNDDKDGDKDEDAEAKKPDEGKADIKDKKDADKAADEKGADEDKDDEHKKKSNKEGDIKDDEEAAEKEEKSDEVKADDEDDKAVRVKLQVCHKSKKSDASTSCTENKKVPKTCFINTTHLRNEHQRAGQNFIVRFSHEMTSLYADN